MPGVLSVAETKKKYKIILHDTIIITTKEKFVKLSYN